MDAFINQYEQILHYFAEFMAFTLELIGPRGREVTKAYQTKNTV